MSAERKLRGKNRLQEIQKPRGYDRGLEMTEIVGATNYTGDLMLLVRWNNCDELDLLPAAEVNIKNPAEVIAFYESKCALNKKAKERNVPNIPQEFKTPTLNDQPSTSSCSVFPTQEPDTNMDVDVDAIQDEKIE